MNAFSLKGKKLLVSFEEQFRSKTVKREPIQQASTTVRFVWCFNIADWLCGVWPKPRGEAERRGIESRNGHWYSVELYCVGDWILGGRWFTRSSQCGEDKADRVRTGKSGNPSISQCVDQGYEIHRGEERKAAISTLCEFLRGVDRRVVVYVAIFRRQRGWVVWCFMDQDCRRGSMITSSIN